MGTWTRVRTGLPLALAMVWACSPAPLQRFTFKTPPLVLAPASATGVEDQRGRFREIFCAVNADRGARLPDHRPCDEAVARLELEPPPSGRPVDLGPSQSELTFVGVLGLGGNCLQNYLAPEITLPERMAVHGIRLTGIEVNGLSSSHENAATIRRAILEREDLQGPGGLVLLGYSKGIVDILEAIVTYPEIRSYVRAVVTVAGAVGGSHFADEAPAWLVKVFELAPGSECEEGDLGALESLKPGVRQRWLAEHPLPDTIRYYSVVAFPTPDRVSNGLERSYERLSQIDPRNDSQLLFYDQIIPGSRLLGFMNADHLAIALPIARSHPWLAEIGIDQNDFPREVLMEAIARHVGEDLSR